MSSSIHIVCPHCNRTNNVPEIRLQDQPHCGNCKNLLFNGHPLELTSLNFNKHLINNRIPVLVDFWAAWCSPCKMMALVIERATAQLEPRVRIAKLNTESEQGIAAQYGIRSIPTLVLFKNGHEIARESGASDLPNLLRWVQSHI